MRSIFNDKTNQKLLSVIVPVFNVESYLDKCIQSIVNQTYKDLEIILVDDGSTDQSGDKCDKWVSQDSRIKVIHKENGGLSSARNAGIDMTSGDILSFIDSDDYIEPDMYRTMIDAMLNTGLDIACCGRIVHLNAKREKAEFNVSKMCCYTKEEAMKQILCHREIDVSACDKLYRKKMFDNIRYPLGKVSEDRAVIMQLLDRANGIVHVTGNYYHYIYRQNSISKSAYSHKNFDNYEHCLKSITFVQQHYPDLVPFAKIQAARVSGGYLSLTQTDPVIKEIYPADFDAYKKIFYEYFPVAFFKEGLPFKEKVELLFTRIGIYPLYVQLKKMIRH